TAKIDPRMTSIPILRIGLVFNPSAETQRVDLIPYNLTPQAFHLGEQECLIRRRIRDRRKLAGPGDYPRELRRARRHRWKVRERISIHFVVPDFDAVPEPRQMVGQRDGEPQVAESAGLQN